MKLLLDTHVFLWWILDAPELSGFARGLMADGRNQLYWSAASSWEIAVKYQLGKLPLPDEPATYIAPHLETNSVESLAIISEHCFQAGRLPTHHRDPFDRILIAQAMVEEMTMLSKDASFSPYPVKVLW